MFSSVVRCSRQYCSDNEDLFGDYDSILGDSSLMAKLDCVEQTARRDDPSLAVDVCGPVERPQTGGFTELRSLKKQSLAQRPGDDHHLTDSILDIFKDDSFEELPPVVAAQLHFNEDVVENIKSCGLLRGDKTSTPLRTKESSRDDRTKMLSVLKNTTEGHAKRPSPKARRSMTDHLKRTMLSNASAPSSVSRTKMLKEAVVTEEINVAMQAMEAVSTETTDLGPFFGLPTKVKDLIYKLRGIKDLYGDLVFTLTLTFRAFGRCFYPKRLTKSTFVERETAIYLSLWYIKIRIEQVSSIHSYKANRTNFIIARLTA